MQRLVLGLLFRHLKFHLVVGAQFSAHTKTVAAPTSAHPSTSVAPGAAVCAARCNVPNRIVDYVKKNNTDYVQKTDEAPVCYHSGCFADASLDCSPGRIVRLSQCTVSS